MWWGPVVAGVGSCSGGRWRGLAGWKALRHRRVQQLCGSAQCERAARQAAHAGVRKRQHQTVNQHAAHVMLTCEQRVW